MDEAIVAVRRTDQALCEQVATWQALDFGVAFCAEAFPGLAEGNQLRDVWLQDVSGEEAFARAEAFYAERGLVCRRWTPAAGQAIEPVAEIMAAKGWRRVESAVMALTDAAVLQHQVPSVYSAGSETAAPAASKSPIRVLPARAMRRACNQTFADAGGQADALAEAGAARLDDSSYDAYVATVGGEPAGRAAYYTVGDIARFADIHVLTSYRRGGVGTAMVAHLLQLVRRMLPRIVVAAVGDEDAGGKTFLSQCGFSRAGTLTSFERDAGSVSE